MTPSGENFALFHAPDPYNKDKLYLIILIALFILFCVWRVARADIVYTDEQIANAIYYAEGGTKTSHPYGILAHYKHTTPRQACLNTIAHARRDFKGGDFIAFLGSRYCPIGANNDPTGLNKNWIRNVKAILRRQNGSFN